MNLLSFVPKKNRKSFFTINSEVQASEEATGRWNLDDTTPFIDAQAAVDSPGIQNWRIFPAERKIYEREETIVAHVRNLEIILVDTQEECDKISKLDRERRRRGDGARGGASAPCALAQRACA
jgi:hypothetical protein